MIKPRAILSDEEIVSDYFNNAVFRGPVNNATTNKAADAYGRIIRDRDEISKQSINSDINYIKEAFEYCPDEIIEDVMSAFNRIIRNSMMRNNDHQLISVQEMIDFCQDEGMDKYIKCDWTLSNMFFAISHHLASAQDARNEVLEEAILICAGKAYAL